jgi:hypothetical protein
MKKDCSKCWEGIVELASGGNAPEARQHLDTCAECTSKFNDLQKMLQALVYPVVEAPVAVRGAAKAIMPQGRPRRVAVLLKSSLAASVRAAPTSEMQALFESGKEKIRLQYRKSARGWEVRGNLPEGAEGAVRGGKAIAIQSGGRFTFTARSLSDTSFMIKLASEDLVVPAIQENGNE